MTKSALLIEMIELLRKRPGLSMEELSSALRRSQRTIYRWINEVSVDLRIPICCNEGGYYLLEHPSDIGANLTAEELAALRLSLRSSPFIDGSPIKRHAESAWKKIRDIAGREKLRLSQQLAEKHQVHITALRADLQPQILETLENAVNSHRRLRIVYRSQKSRAVKHYTIDPYALTFRRHSWYLLAYSHEHNKVVQFKLARFWSAQEVGVEFEPPREFSADAFYRLSWEAWAGDEAIEVKVRFSSEVALMVSETLRHPTQVMHPQPDGSVIMEVTVSAIEEIAAWILGYGKEAEVLEPARLRNYILEHALGLVDNYTKISGGRLSN